MGEFESGFCLADSADVVFFAFYGEYVGIFYGFEVDILPVVLEVSEGELKFLEDGFCGL